jgi:NAD(P)-dependent dehydrogenase (short-subunit alcohol dehydrogenase family)
VTATGPFRLDGRVALVTGAGSARGIGREVARAFSVAGARVALADRDADGARRNAAELGAGALGLAVDVTDPDSVARAVAEVRDRLGPVDVLVCSAGISRSTPIWDMTLEEFDQVMAVNVRGGLVCLKAVLPDMRARGWGRVILLGSQAGKQGGGVFGATHYACSKAALRGLCQGAARELGPFGVTCNTIAPGMVDTDIIVSGGATPEQRDRLAEQVSAAAPVRRVGRATDIAAAALFLASDEAGYVTGEVMDVNGGAYFD